MRSHHLGSLFLFLNAQMMMRSHNLFFLKRKLSCDLLAWPSRPYYEPAVNGHKKERKVVKEETSYAITGFFSFIMVIVTRFSSFSYNFSLIWASACQSSTVFFWLMLLLMKRKGTSMSRRQRRTSCPDLFHAVADQLIVHLFFLYVGALLFLIMSPNIYKEKEIADDQ